MEFMTVSHIIKIITNNVGENIEPVSVEAY